MPDDHDRLIRLEEKQTAADFALELRTREIERRLDNLNHAHEQARQRDNEFVPRELYQSQHDLLVTAVGQNRDAITALTAGGVGRQQADDRSTTVILAVVAVIVSFIGGAGTLIFLAVHG